MREILCRGKRIDINEWVEGYYAVSPTDSKSYIYAKDYTEVDIAEDGLHVAYRLMQVFPTTVGQYTGLTDKNGKKIFEGDILSIAQKGNGIGDYFYPPLKYPSNAIVKWDKCSWMWEIIAEQRYYLTFPDAWCHFECKIIGNIHDNPELLEVEK